MANRTLIILAAVSALWLNTGCNNSPRRSLPAEAQSTLQTAIDDIDNGRYDKLYRESADEWRKEASFEKSKQTFQTLRDKLGNVRTRNQQSAREEQTSTGPIPGHSVVVMYETSFDRGTGMETFTLLEKNGQWYLARYFVNSSSLR